MNAPSFLTVSILAHTVCKRPSFSGKRSVQLTPKIQTVFSDDFRGRVLVAEGSSSIKGGKTKAIQVYYYPSRGNDDSANSGEANSKGVFRGFPMHLAWRGGFSIIYTPQSDAARIGQGPKLFKLLSGPNNRRGIEYLFKPDGTLMQRLRIQGDRYKPTLAQKTPAKRQAQLADILAWVKEHITVEADRSV